MDCTKMTENEILLTEHFSRENAKNLATLKNQLAEQLTHEVSMALGFLDREKPNLDLGVRRLHRILEQLSGLRSE